MATIVLIRLPEHRPEDLAAWERWERQDAALAGSRSMGDRAAEAIDVVARFSAAPCYAAVSWGKDSTVVAHLAWTVAQCGGPTIPLVWIRVEPIKNPHCALVRDAFLHAFPHPYDEIETWCQQDGAGWHATGTLEAGIVLARQRYGPRTIMGLRAEENAGRKRRIARGPVVGDSCLPLGPWTADDVFAYLYRERLPVHPAYAFSHGGRANRGRLRVASIGGKRGDGMGRMEWERHYYGGGS